MSNSQKKMLWAVGAVLLLLFFVVISSNLARNRCLSLDRELSDSPVILPLTKCGWDGTIWRVVRYSLARSSSPGKKSCRLIKIATTQSSHSPTHRQGNERFYWTVVKVKDDAVALHIFSCCIWLSPYRPGMAGRSRARRQSARSARAFPRERALERVSGTTSTA
jgi:hypothetical protein